MNDVRTERGEHLAQAQEGGGIGRLQRGAQRCVVPKQRSSAAPGGGLPAALAKRRTSWPRSRSALRSSCIWISAPPPGFA